MERLFYRISNRINITAKSFASDCHFSLYYACLRVADELGARIGLKRLSKAAHGKRETWIFRYLERVLKPVLDAYSKDEDKGDVVENAPIWVCWWAGEDTAPPLVKRCIKSIRENAGQHPVCFIDHTNWSDYVEIPNHILSKVERGELGLAHLADYLRVSLLARYGGLWLDATMFCSQEIPQSIFSLALFTCKSELRECTYISKYRWVTFCLGGNRGHVFFRYLVDAFDAYWLCAPRAVDYLFFDYVIELGYRWIPAIRECIDAVPINNVHRDDLQAAMNACLPGEAWNAVVKTETVLYKLSWREIYQEKTPDGGKSIYVRFLEE